MAISKKALGFDNRIYRNFKKVIFYTWKWSHDQ